MAHPLSASNPSSNQGIGAGSAELVSAQGVYRERVLDLIEPRVEVKMVDLKADDVVRSVKRLAEDAKVADRIFPFGVTPIVKPVGKSQVDELPRDKATQDAFFDAERLSVTTHMKEPRRMHALRGFFVTVPRP